MAEALDLVKEEEARYFAQVMERIRTQIVQETAAYDDAEKELRTYLYSSWEDGTHMGASIDRLIEAVQIGKFARTQELLADKRLTRIRNLQHLADSAYFARVDFTEDGEDEEERIYIGRHTLYDEKDRTPMVYDWRAPISSIFYRFERGPVKFDAPAGEVRGEVSLKRQYEIRKGELLYFFDADVQISDDFLRRMLSENTSSRMKTIVETIQKEQDVVIRDSASDLLIVQGVAGSGKTSIALHRVAYLMYEGLQNRLNASDIVILSPNTLFESYISGVLPELGEQNITTLEFEEIAKKICGTRIGTVGTRNDYLEAMIAAPDEALRTAMKRDMKFKTSAGFATILKRWRDACVRNLPLSDVTCGEKTLFPSDDLKAMLTRREDRASVEGRIFRMRETVWEALRHAQEERHAVLTEQAAGKREDAQEDAVYARMLAIEEAAKTRRTLEKASTLDYPALYSALVTDPARITALVGGKKIRDLDAICSYTRKHLAFDHLPYADAMAFSWFLLQFRAADLYKGIKQVVVDEAQDYMPIQYEILNRLFPRARYTVLGDVNQSIGKVEDETIYDTIERILSRKVNLRITMHKSFRCTNQIIAFSSRFVDERFGLESFNRDGEEPKILQYADRGAMNAAIPALVNELKENGCGSVAVITKTAKDAAALYTALSEDDVHLIVQDKEADLTGTLILPIYLAKGLEFDGVIVYGANADDYRAEDDRRLLYIASTRALHALRVLCDGTPSPYLTEAAHV